MEMINALGRRKSAVARVFVKNGDGNIVINGKPLEAYFPQAHIRNKVSDPFNVVSIENTYDIRVNVKAVELRVRLKPSDSVFRGHLYKSMRTSKSRSRIKNCSQGMPDRSRERNTEDQRREKHSSSASVNRLFYYSIQEKLSQQCIHQLMRNY